MSISGIGLAEGEVLVELDGVGGQRQIVQQEGNEGGVHLFEQGGQFGVFHLATELDIGELSQGGGGAVFHPANEQEIEAGVFAGGGAHGFDVEPGFDGSHVADERAPIGGGGRGGGNREG